MQINHGAIRLPQFEKWCHIYLESFIFESHKSREIDAWKLSWKFIDTVYYIVSGMEGINVN